MIESRGATADRGPEGSPARQATLLLVLDNFEQVLEAAPMVAELLSRRPDLKVAGHQPHPLEALRASRSTRCLPSRCPTREAACRSSSA